MLSFRPSRARAVTPRTTSGFTLVEVMVAAMLLMFALAGLVPFFITALSQSSLVRYKSTATNIARERMEEIRQLDYREITDASFLGDRFGTSEAVRGVTYNVVYAVEQAAYDSGVLKEVTVTVGWNAPPRVSAASLTTMIHQQYVGPRLARMELSDSLPDPLGTPFDCLLPDQMQTLYCYIAEPDWGLVIDNLNEPGMTVRDAYLRLSLVDSTGTAVQLGSASNDYRITGLNYTTNSTTGNVDSVYIPYAFDSGDIPDGYWEFQGVVFNRYEEPGNLWRLRLRVENSGPAAPTSVAAMPQVGDASVRLYWSGGAERDRAYYSVQRCKWDWATSTWGAWVPVDMAMDAMATNLLDEGDSSLPSDPWGSLATPNLYQYRIWAVDIAGKPGPPSLASVGLPPSTPVTTTTVLVTTTTSAVTTTTTPPITAFTVVINNTVNKTYSILIEPGDISKPDINTTVGKKTTKSVSGLSAGSYDITAIHSGRAVAHASFTLDSADDNNMIVLNIY